MKNEIIKLVDLINQVRQEPEPKMLWKGIPERSHGLITGVAKTGKTTFAENLAISLSIGKDEFFGYKMDKIPRKVLFVNLEESYKIRCRRNLKQISQLSEDEFELFSNNFDTTPQDFLEFIDDENDWIKLNEYICSSDAEVVFIDSLTHMFSGKIEDSSAGRKFTQLYTKYLLDIDKTVIIIHHNVKGNDKPMEQDSCSGSRVILQWFQFIYGLASVPNESGGSYVCMLNNKYVEKDSETAYMYRVNENAWFEYLGKENKYQLYKENSKKTFDGRRDNTNEEIIYNYMASQTSLGNEYVTSSSMLEEFVNTVQPVMSKDTLYKAAKRLIVDNRIEKIGKGNYKIIIEDGKGI